MKNFILFILLLFVLACNDVSKSKQQKLIQNTEFQNPPSWAEAVIWYELSVERFRNGDTANDPTAEDIVGSYPGFVPEGWSITPWTHDWYKSDPYFENSKDFRDFYGNRLDNFVQKAQMRRYGGDLQGVLDKIGYLDSLGITAVYFRPLNDAPSLHKYDARNWRHVDVNFGPNPVKDKATIASETPDDPSTWRMTEADQLFLKVIDVFHQKGIRVILDYSWNHTGKTFWAWQDVLEKQEQSAYKDWYWIDEFDDPQTPNNEFKYHGWSGVHTLPELKETQKQDLSVRLTSFPGNLFSEAAKQHIFNVTKRWLDPNGDGDPSDGVDGYRLDVAAEMPLGFWQDFRKQVRQVNPNAYLLGEIWWEEWPDKLLNPKPYLEGDIFDAVMNYRWYKAVRQFFNAAPNPIPTAELIDSLNSFRADIRDENDYAMMNYTGGYDTPRILTSLFNKTKYKYGCKVHENPSYKIHQPDQATYETLRLLLIQQYTYIGAPHIYMGDEMGMWGADDPSSRKPLIWQDYTFEAERAHPLNQERPIDKVKFNEDLFRFHQQLIRIRKENPLLVSGDLEFIKIDAQGTLLAYRRFDEKQEILVIFNHQEITKKIEIKPTVLGKYIDLLRNAKVQNVNGLVNIEIPARSACILVTE